ncbi:GYD family protein [Natrialba chahannaoensis JCM 10990]|uniref:GYD family protein n=1 Tax=Natrialba chahannaoensis JCM 10990 TaxID=1227492 RepID=M0AUA2_9EURY|nr:GYD domain-containing protein [Natrialba chahannaoensis]ELZ01917.1 GYD family protein [Natrialba chahannaoensis JCM 10990]
MPTYIHLTSYTGEGVQNITDSPDRLDDAKDLAASLDGEFKEFFLTFGEYDIVAITEFPDDETAAQFALGVASEGAVTTETLKAFTEDEYRDVITGLP